jgi:GH15 family glucan-1,4-alpha-glucosidase
MLDDSIEKSLEVIAEFQRESGAYPASPHYKPYNYTWFRDGSFVADGMSRGGRPDSAERFFSWGTKVILDRKDTVMNGGRLDTRFTYDGQESTEEWANFQLDGYGLFLWALKGHIDRHNLSVDTYKDVIAVLQFYLATHWQEPCFDWWEERMGVHAATLACVYAGLKAFDHPDAQSVKGAIDLTSERLDASLLICVLLDAVDVEAFSLTLQQIEETLVSRGGGVHRFQDDVYYGGGEWPVLTAMLGWYYLKMGRTDAARALMVWCTAQADPSHFIPEQSQSHLMHPDEYDTWVTQSGNPASPLLWSHAMVLILATELIDSF